jgi:hypothetical protein
MTKTKPETLVDEIADDFNSYLSKGVRVGEITGEVDPNLNIEDIEKLLRIHFVLTEGSEQEAGVIGFVDGLREEVRRIKTTVTKDTVFLENEVRGRIDWQETIKERYRSASPDIGYACTQTRENYNIEENLVLKRLLSVIHEIVHDDLKPALDNPDEYEWLGRWVATDEEERENLNEVLNDVFLNNIYLQRIETDENRITDRMIESVKKSRSSLYRDAANLLDRYRRLTAQDIDTEEAASLLRNTFIRPSETERLFELYWVFRILGEYDNARFKLIEEGSDGVVARWEEDGYEYKLFHDSVGGMTFSEDADLEDAPDDGYFRRVVHVDNKFEDLRSELLNEGTDDGLWGGRPDVLIERRDGDDELDEVFIGEVKYTRYKGYAAQGLRELLEYMVFAKESVGYVEEESDPFDFHNVRGMLFVDSVENEDGEAVEVSCFGDDLQQVI